MTKYNHLTNLFIGEKQHNQNYCDLHFSHEFFPKNIKILFQMQSIPFQMKQIKANGNLLYFNPHKDNYLNDHCNGVEFKFLKAYTYTNHHELSFENNILTYENTKFTIEQNVIDRGFSKIFTQYHEDINIEYSCNQQKEECYTFNGKKFYDVSPIFPCGGIFNPRSISNCQQLYFFLVEDKLLERHTAPEFIKDIHVHESFFISQVYSTNDTLKNYINNGNFAFSVQYENQNIDSEYIINQTYVSNAFFQKQAGEIEIHFSKKFST